MVRRAYRSAQRLGAELDLLWVTDREPTEEEQEQIEALRRLASVLGAHLLIEHGDDVAHVAQRVANERGTTYVLMGTPKPRSAIRRLTQPALPFRLLRLLPGVDLRIVADRTQRTHGGAMTAVLIALVVALALALVALAAANLRLPHPAAIADPGNRYAADSVPVRRLRALTPRARRRTAARERRGRNPRPRIPGPRAAPPAAATPRCRGSPGSRSRCKRRSSTARARSGSSSTPGSSVGAPTATRSGRRSPTSASTGS